MSLRVDGGRPEAARSLRNSFGADPVGLRRTPSDGHRSFVNRSQTGVDHPASDQRKSATTSRSKLIRKLSVRGDLDNSGRCPPLDTDRSGAGAVPFTTGQQETIRRGHGPGQSRPRVDHAEMLARWGVCAPSLQLINSLCKWNDCAKLGRRYCLHNQIADDSSQDSGVCALVVDGSAAISRPLSNDRRRRQMGG